MYGRRGKLFLLPFQRKPITNPWHFFNTWKCIHYNPLHHGFTDDVYSWPFSSIHDYRQKKSNKITLMEAQRKSDTSLEFSQMKDFKPDWNDFLDFNY